MIPILTLLVDYTNTLKEGMYLDVTELDYEVASEVIRYHFKECNNLVSSVSEVLEKDISMTNLVKTRKEAEGWYDSFLDFEKKDDPDGLLKYLVSEDNLVPYFKSYMKVTARVLASRTDNASIKKVLMDFFKLSESSIARKDKVCMEKLDDMPSDYESKFLEQARVKTWTEGPLLDFLKEFSNNQRELINFPVDDVLFVVNLTENNISLLVGDASDDLSIFIPTGTGPVPLDHEIYSNSLDFLKFIKEGYLVYMNESQHKEYQKLLEREV